MIGADLSAAVPRPSRGGHGRSLERGSCPSCRPPTASAGGRAEQVRRRHAGDAAEQHAAVLEARRAGASTPGVSLTSMLDPARAGQADVEMHEADRPAVDAHRCEERDGDLAAERREEVAARRTRRRAVGERQEAAAERARKARPGLRPGRTRAGGRCGRRGMPPKAAGTPSAGSRQARARRRRGRCGERAGTARGRSSRPRTAGLTSSSDSAGRGLADAAGDQFCLAARPPPAARGPAWLRCERARSFVWKTAIAPSSSEATSPKIASARIAATPSGRAQRGAGGCAPWRREKRQVCVFVSSGARLGRTRGPLDACKICAHGRPPGPHRRSRPGRLRPMPVVCRTSPSRRLSPTGSSARADRAAAAALRELPDALILAFDQRASLRAHRRAGARARRHPRHLRAGPAGRRTRSRPRSGRRSSRCSARRWTGETRSREVWTAEGRALPDGRRRPARRPRAPAPRQRSPAASPSCWTSPRAGAPTCSARRLARATSSRCSSGAPVGTGLLDSDGRWLLVNRALCDITGYTADELIGKRFDGIMHPEDVANDAERAPPPARRRGPRLSGREALLRRLRRDRLGDPVDVARARSRRRSRSTTSPSCRTSPSASASRSTCATSPITIRSPACATAGCSSTTSSCRSPARSATARSPALMVLDLDSSSRSTTATGTRSATTRCQAVATRAQPPPARNRSGRAARRRRVRGAAAAHRRGRAGGRRRGPHARDTRVQHRRRASASCTRSAASASR